MAAFLIDALDVALLLLFVFRILLATLSDLPLSSSHRSHLPNAKHYLHQDIRAFLDLALHFFLV
jgi:hypothetical protein